MSVNSRLIKAAAQDLHEALNRLEELDDGKVYSNLVKIHRGNVLLAGRIIAAWDIYQADLAEEMYNASNSILASVNKLAEEQEPTVDTLYRAANLVGAEVKANIPRPKDLETDEDGQNGQAQITRDKGNKPDLGNAAERVVKAAVRLSFAIADAQKVDLVNISFVNLYQGGVCAVSSESEAVLRFTPESVSIKKGEKVGVRVIGGRAPYYWAPMGAVPPGLTIEQSGTSSSSALFTISTTANTPEGLAKIAFGSLHPKSEPQILDVTVAR